MADNKQSTLIERLKQQADSLVSSAQKKGSRLVGVIKTSKSGAKAKDTSGKLKKIHGRSAKSLSDKSRKSDWHKQFYKDAPVGRLKRTLWLLHPKRQAQFWFSKHGLKLAGKIAAIGLGVGLLIGLLAYGYYSRQLRGPEEIRNRLLSQSTQFYDRTGEELLYETFGDEDRTVVEWDEISDYVKDATVAVEDKNFYKHNGIDLSAITRAGIAYVRNSGEITQGGSTITQQFIKKSLLTDEQSFDRKIKEAILAIELERLYSKQEILQFYLNEVPYGGTSYGIQAASENYFRKSAKDLTLDEAALLAALPQRPTFFINNLDQLEIRKSYVLDQMVDQDYITVEQAEEAKGIKTAQNMKFDRNQYRDIEAPHFVLEARQALEEKYGADVVATGGLKVTTTVDLELQKMAEKAVADNIANVVASGGNNAALTSIDPNTGQILAMVGSRDFEYEGYGSYNVATARRQPGSSFKPYVYATLMQENYGAGSIFYDINKMNFGSESNPYEPSNFDNSSRGPLTIRQSIAESRNIPAVKSIYIAGIENVIEQTEKMGVDLTGSPENYGLSLALGAGEVRLVDHTAAYGAFANEGILHETSYILKIENSQGEVIEEWSEERGERVVDEEIAYIMSEMLRDVDAKRPTYSNLDYFVLPGTQMATKTGTTNALRDGWLLGYTTSISTGVWAGHSDNLKMNRATSGITGPIYRQYMRDANEYIKNSDQYPDPVDFKKPSGIKSVTLDRYTGREPLSGASNTVTDIFPSWYKRPSSESTEPFTIDTVSGLLATECTPEAARKEVRVGGIAPEIPPSDPAYARWNSALRGYLGRADLGGSDGIAAKPTKEDNVHKCNDKPPQIDSLDFNSSNNTVTVSAKKGTFNLDRLLIKIDGQTVDGGAFSASGSSVSRSVKINKSSGSYRLSAEVTDKGLYSDTRSQNITISGGGGSINAQSPSGNEYDNNDDITFSWSSVSGANNYTVSISGRSENCTTSSTSCTIEPNGSWSNGNYTWTVTVKGGPNNNDSDSGSFSID